MAQDKRKRSDRPAGPTLFGSELAGFEPTGVARLRRVIREAGEPHFTRDELKRREDRRTMAKIQGWGADLARRFDLRYRALEAERDGVTEHYGVCYEDGVILIRLRHARTGRLLKESSLADTLCHELAHLRHFDHGARFRRLHQQILATARRLGYYRPGPSPGWRPRQRGLFDTEDHASADGVGCGAHTE